MELVVGRGTRARDSGEHGGRVVTRGHACTRVFLWLPRQGSDEASCFPEGWGLPSINSNLATANGEEAEGHEVEFGFPACSALLKWDAVQRATS